MASSGPNSPGTLANDSTGGGTAWSNPSNAASSNNIHASLSLSGLGLSQYLKATNFSFSIPSGATIDGIIVDVEKTDQGSSALRDNIVRLVKGGTIVGSNLGDTTSNWPDPEVYKTYGGATNLWGTTWTDTDINSSTFGVVFKCFNANMKFSVPGDVDHIRITIHYTSSGGVSSNSLLMAGD